MLITTVSVLSDYFNFFFFFIMISFYDPAFFFFFLFPGNTKKKKEKKKHIPQPLCLEGSDIKYRTICQLQQEIKMMDWRDRASLPPQPFPLLSARGAQADAEKGGGNGRLGEYLGFWGLWQPGEGKAGGGGSFKQQPES